MKDYSDFPPVNSFKRVLTNCPQSALLYASIWKRNNKSELISIKRKDIKKHFFISQTIFRNQLLALERHGILSLVETTNLFVIDFYENDKS